MKYASLVSGALAIAAIEYPDLDARHYLGKIDSLAHDASQAFAWDGDQFDQIRSFNDFMFEDYGFTGNHDDYYDPRNSFINDVLDRKLGIPISLSVIYIEVARRLGLPVSGVNFPGHFLVKWELATGLAVVDPYSRGTCLDEDDLNNILNHLAGEGAPSVAELPALLASVDDDAVMVRMLRNLKAIYAKRDQHDKVLTTLDRIIDIRNDANSERLERAELYEKLECFRAAISDLETLANRRITGVGSVDEDVVTESLHRLKTSAVTYH